MKQAANQLMMIRPVAFEFNSEAAESNLFAQHSKLEGVQAEARNCFDEMLRMLRKNDIEVLELEDTLDPKTPDSIFPNNWISFHANGALVLYPMEAKNRQLERTEKIISLIQENYQVEDIIDLSKYEEQFEYLEGTGSLVLDRVQKIAYMCRSSRSSELVLKRWLDIFPEYKAKAFSALDSSKIPIYHTNVMMCLGTRFVSICLEAVQNRKERAGLINSFIDSGKEIIDLSMKQLYSFAGNMLEVENKQGESKIVMSSKAYYSLSPLQLSQLGKYGSILHCNLGPIETQGGGSARCMMAEIFLKKKGL